MTISYPIAFMSGIISFFAPCVIPLLPTYIAYVTGVSLKDLEDGGYEKYRNKILSSSVFYILGFSIIFTLLGSTAAGIGIFFRRHIQEVQIVGGLLMIIFGLEFAGVFNMAFLAKERKLKLPKFVENTPNIRSFILGIIFSLTWSPCIGAILGSIYALAAVSGSAMYGASLLFVYSLGISLPFLIVSLTLLQAPKYLKAITKHISLISKISGAILVLLGLSLVTGYYAHVNAFVFDIAFSLGYTIPNF